MTTSGLRYEQDAPAADRQSAPPSRAVSDAPGFRPDTERSGLPAIAQVPAAGPDRAGTGPRAAARSGKPGPRAYWPGDVTWLAGGSMTCTGWLIPVMFMVVVTLLPLTVSFSITRRTWCWPSIHSRKLMMLSPSVFSCGPRTSRTLGDSALIASEARMEPSYSVVWTPSIV